MSCSNIAFWHLEAVQTMGSNCTITREDMNAHSSTSIKHSYIDKRLNLRGYMSDITSLITMFGILIRNPTRNITRLDCLHRTPVGPTIDIVSYIRQYLPFTRKRVNAHSPKNKAAAISIKRQPQRPDVRYAS